MIGNRSSAVMQQRSEPHDSLDDFPTPPWAGRALCEHLEGLDGNPPGLSSAWEPASNRGSLWTALNESFDTVHASDIFDYGHVKSQHVRDFLWSHSEDDIAPVDWIITNPPFRLAEQFIARALEIADVGCAMLLRTAFTESDGRYDRLFSVNPPTRILFFAERVVMLKGRLVRAGATDWTATEKARETNPDTPEKKASTATSYAWFIWIRNAAPMPPAWIPSGSRLRLEREGDYDLF